MPRAFRAEPLVPAGADEGMHLGDVRRRSASGRCRSPRPAHRRRPDWRRSRHPAASRRAGAPTTRRVSPASRSPRSRRRRRSRSARRASARQRLGAHLRVGLVMVGAPLGMADDDRLAPASASISAAMSPVWAPEARRGSPARRSRRPSPRAACGEGRDQGGRRADQQFGLGRQRPGPGDRSWPARRPRLPSPFIFQLPATSGRGVCHAMTRVPVRRCG